MTINNFIFEISNNDLGNSSQIPVVNLGGSFSGLSSNFIKNGDTTRIDISWNSYTNKNSSDGLSFRQINYGTTSSINIKQFGGIILPNMTSIENSSFYNFSGKITASDTPIIINPSLSHCFAGSTSNNFGNINNWDVSVVTKMDYMFVNTSNFNQNINNWNTSNVIDMTHMFSYSSSFNQNISYWNTSKVTNMSYMFYSASTFNQDISGWNTSNVTNMSFMFYGASIFNQPNISKWNYSKILSINNFITNTGFTLTSCYLFLLGLLNNNTISNVSLDIVPNISYSNYQYILPLLNNKNVTFIIPDFILIGIQNELIITNNIYFKDAICNGDSNLSGPRHEYIQSFNNQPVSIQKKWIGGNRDSSDRMRNLRMNAIGNEILNKKMKSVIKSSPINTIRDAIKNVRNGGSVVPAKVIHKYDNAPTFY
jgi:surface protein